MKRPRRGLLVALVLSAILAPGSPGRAEDLNQAWTIALQVNSRVLAQQEATRSELAERVRTAATQLTDDPHYPEILQRLTARSQRILGPAALVTVSPAGGVRAVAGSRTLDLTLPTLATRKLDSMSTEVAALWTA